MGFGVGFQLMNAVFPLLFLIVFVFVISTIVGTFVSKAKRERKNDQSPRLTAEAKVVSNVCRWARTATGTETTT